MSKVFVLRTHALLSSRRSTLRFGDDNEIVIPLTVVDELRETKHESFEKRRIARDLLEYINSFPINELMSEKGVKQENGSALRVTNNFKDVSVNVEGLTNPEMRTLQTCLGIMNKEKKNVILVTNNLSLQLKAKSLGINAESFKDEVFPRLSEQYTGREEIYVSDSTIDSFYKNGFVEVKDVFDNSEIEFIENKFFIMLSPTGKSALGILKQGRIVKLRHQEEYPYGVKAKNVGQKFLLEALLDDNCPLVVIKGSAGTGKTYCALAAGLQGIENKKYERILVTRYATSTAEEKVGFLPGDLREKMDPYLAGVNTNLPILINGKNKKTNADETHYETGKYFFERGIIQIQAIGYIRGATITNSYFLIDETQNIKPDDIKSIVTRNGEGSKFIFLGDQTQIDHPELNERYNGLVYLSEKMKGSSMCVQVTLNEDESVRSELAREAAKIL